MLIVLTIILFFAKYLLLAAFGLFLYMDLTITQDVSSGIYSVYLTFACLTFFSLVFFILGRRLLWLIVFLVCGGIYIGMYKNAPEISEIHQKSLLNDPSIEKNLGTVKKVYTIWKMFH